MLSIKVEQFKLMNALYFLRNFIGKEKDQGTFVQIKIENGHVMLETNNKSVYGKVELDVLSSQGEGIFPYIDTDDLIKLLKTENGAIELDIYTEDNLHLNIMHVGRYKNVNGIKVMNPIVLNGAQVNFMSMPNVTINTTFDIETEIFRQGVNVSSNIVSPGDIIRGCVCVTVKAPNIILFETLNTNSMLMAYGLPYKNNLNCRFFFDCTKAKYILQQFEGNMLNISISNNFIIFKQDNKTAFFQLNAGTFPPITKLMSNQYKYTYKICKNEFYPITERILVYLKKDVLKACTVELENMLGTIKIANSKGKNEEIFTVDGSLDHIKKCFNIETLMKAINIIDSDEIYFNIYENENVVVTPVSNNIIQKIMIPRISEK